MINLRKQQTKQTYIKLKAEIESGRYKPGTFLPAERKLSEIYGISRKALRNILFNLEAEGLVRMISSRGTRVSEKSIKKSLTRFMARSNPVGNKNSAVEREKILLGICKGAGKYLADSLITFSSLSETIKDAISRYEGSLDIQGLVIAGGKDISQHIKRLEKSRMPYVLANLEENVPSVCTRMNFREIGRKAGRYLIENHHRNITVMTGPLDRFIYQEILAGFRGALAEENIFLNKNHIFEVESAMETSRKTCIELLKRKKRPTAIFTMRDIRAAGCYAACRELKVKIPQEISILSYDDVSWSEAENAGLTTFKEPVEEIGIGAVELLNQWVTTGIKPTSKIYDCTLVVRKSVIPWKN